MASPPDQEDAIPRTGLPASETDLSDEVQDFRFLSAHADAAKIPKRGEKDFEPHATDLQAGHLAASRAAMHAALTFPRLHAARRANAAVYHAPTNTAFADAPRSTLFRAMGSVRGPVDDGGLERNANRVWLLPEEVLYLVERGTVDCRFADGTSLSVQAAYALFLGRAGEFGDGLTAERYSVYAYLKRAGYVVQRAETWGTVPEGLAEGNFAPRTWGLGLRWGVWWGGREEGRVGGGRWRSYPDIYRALAVVPWYDPTTQYASPARPREQDLRVTFNVWKPNNATFKKSKPGPPDFRVAVVDARTTTLPSLVDLAGLMDTVPYAPPAEGMSLYAKLKHGYKSVILAVVDQGVTSFTRLSDTGSGREQLYIRAKPKGKKGGGKGGKGGKGK